MDFLYVCFHRNSELNKNKNYLSSMYSFQEILFFNQGLCMSDFPIFKLVVIDFFGNLGALKEVNSILLSKKIHVVNKAFNITF